MNFPSPLQVRWRGQRVNSFNRVLRDGFATRIYKIGLPPDFTCANRDGNVAVGGCIYCNNTCHTREQARHAQRDSARTDTPRRVARPALYKARVSD